MKIIIENKTDLSYSVVFSRVMLVMDMGRISETAKGKQYCFVCTWDDGIIVSAFKNEKSDRFVIRKTESKDG